MRVLFHFSCRTILTRFGQALENHLVQLHEMIVAGLSLNHFSHMGEMVGWNFGPQREAPLSESGKLLERFKFIVGAPLVETAGASVVGRSSTVKPQCRSALDVIQIQKIGEK